MRIAIVAHRATEANLELAARLPGTLLAPPDALRALGPSDVALARLDVRTELDRVEDGLDELAELERRGVTVLNPAEALLTAHDKLLTARALRRAGLPHPWTRWLPADARPPETEFPVVVKPRFGSWGADVSLARDAPALEDLLERLSFRPWFRSTGALLQELVPPLGHDLRVVVAAGRAVGAIRRVAPTGEWRTNVALGARREPTIPPPVASRLACAAAAAVGADLVGVDLLPLGPGRFCVLEVNGAVEFSAEYAPGNDVFQAAADALTRRPAARVASLSRAASSSVSWPRSSRHDQLPFVLPG